MNNNTIILAGGSGLVGKHLSEKLIKAGYDLIILTRRAKKSKNTHIQYIEWDPAKNFIAADVIKNAKAVVNLAGKNLANERWTRKVKSQIMDSRIQSTSTLVQALKCDNNRNIAFIQMSATGYYNNESDGRIVDENAPAGEDFLSKVCVAWERTAKEVESLGARLVIFRSGVVLSNKGGALPKISLPIKMNVGAAVGSGMQWVAWVHIDDLCDAILWAIEHSSVEGIYNVVSPDIITNKELTLAIAKGYNKKIRLPNIPEFVMRLLFGEMSETLTKGAAISSRKIQQAGFQFKYAKIEKAVVNNDERQ